MTLVTDRFGLDHEELFSIYAIWRIRMPIRVHVMRSGSIGIPNAPRSGQAGAQSGGDQLRLSQ